MINLRVIALQRLVLPLVGLAIYGFAGNLRAQDKSALEQKSSSSQETARGIRLVEVQKIWDRAPHNAFTDLIRFKDRWFCVFREGQKHVSPDGALRVICSDDGKQWQSAALITADDADLRDAKLNVLPDGTLMLSGAAALHDTSQQTHQSLAWYSSDGHSWSTAHPIGDPNYWIWRATWHGDQALAVGYDCGKVHRDVRLYKTTDGRRFETVVDKLFEIGYPNESSIVFRNGKAYCLLRRDGNPNTGLLGVSNPPFQQWKWSDLKVRIGGPHMIQLSDGRILAAVRLYDDAVRTSLCWIEPETDSIHEILKLPSGGDTSYAGLVEHEGLIWVSYYSSHEGKTCIYLAKVEKQP